jgi:hypothetical protein
MRRRRFFQALLGGTAAVLGASRLKASSLLLDGPREATLPSIPDKPPYTSQEDILGGLPSYMTEEQGDLIYRLLSTAAGRQRLAGSLGPALRRRRDYMSLARKAFCVVDGTRIDSLNSLSLCCASPLDTGMHVRLQNSANAPTFEITSRVVFPATHVEERRFDLVARGLNLGKAEVVQAEDRWLFALIDAVAEDSLPFGPRFLDRARERLSGKGIKEVQYAFAHPYDYPEVLRLAWAGYRPNHNRTTLKTGLMGSMDGVELYQSRSVPQGWMYVTGHTEATESVDGINNAVHAGYVVDKTKLSVDSSDQPPGYIGFLIGEESGFAVNPAAVQRVSMGGHKAGAAYSRYRAEPPKT